MTIQQAIEQATERRPIPLRVLSVRTGISTRACKAAIQRLRRSGYPVCSSRGKQNGYYLSTDGDYAKVLYREAVTRLVTLKQMVTSGRIKELLGQLRMEIEA